MTPRAKLKKRGFVMTGGGAKGLYEAGVIHAFHITGMEFDVITGSSIGAMNSIFFAEYLYQKRLLPAETLSDPARAVEALDPFVKAFHHAWLQFPDRKIVDDSAQGPIGQLKDDLETVDLDVPPLVRLAWWWTDPDHKSVPPPTVWPALIRLAGQLVNHLGGVNELLRIYKYNQGNMLQEFARTYLRRFGLEHALVPPDQDHKVKDVFTLPISALRPEHLSGDASAPDTPGTATYILVDPERTLRDYAQKDITVRLTRANFRTGRLEMSTYVPIDSFVRFMEKQAWRLQVANPDQIPLGSFRLQIPGNPNAINAAVCSGRFPGVFSPYPITSIYPASDPENALLYHMLEDWLASPDVQTAIQQARTDTPGSMPAARWQDLFNSWRDSRSMRAFFPNASDVFVDGGTIDNTPSNSAVDFVKEWIEHQGLSKRDVALELFIIYLDIEPQSTFLQVEDPASFEVVQRTLDIQGAANRSSDANTVQTINSFGQRAEDLATVLNLVLDNVQTTFATLTPDQQRQLQNNIYTQANDLALRGFLGEQADGILTRIDDWLRQTMEKGLPVHVDPIKVYPEKMALDTLQFTERLGYRKENAILMLTTGCADTLWTLRNHLETQPAPLDTLDQQVLALAKHWMDSDNSAAWPANPGDQAKMRSTWQCQRTACVFHAHHCQHGAMIRTAETA
jgi:hypothetical protein